MGLLSEVLLLPMAPARLALWAMDRVVEVAEREYGDPTAVRRQLAELNRQLDAGSISEEEFDRCEDELLDRLYPTHTDRGPS
jgi:cytochrome c-type biogenesis protein CcmH/NrfG